MAANLIAVGERSFESSAPVQLLTWLCRRQVFGTYLHLLRGEVDADLSVSPLASCPVWLT